MLAANSPAFAPCIMQPRAKRGVPSASGALCGVCGSDNPALVDHGILLRAIRSSASPVAGGAGGGSLVHSVHTPTSIGSALWNTRPVPAASASRGFVDRIDRSVARAVRGIRRDPGSETSRARPGVPRYIVQYSSNDHPERPVGSPCHLSHRDCATSQPCPDAPALVRTATPVSTSRPHHGTPSRPRGTPG